MFKKITTILVFCLAILGIGLAIILFNPNRFPSLSESKSAILYSDLKSLVPTPKYRNQNDDIIKPMQTNSWFTPAYTFPTSYIHASPGFYKFDRTGILISQLNTAPGPKSIVSGFGHECTISFNSEIQNIEVNNYGDWSVNIDLITGNGQGNLTLVQGMPVVYINPPKDSLKLDCPNAEVSLINQSALIKYGKDAYLLQSKSSTLTESDSVVSGHSSQFRLILVPESSIISNLINLSWNPISSTEMQFSQLNQDWISEYLFYSEKESEILTTIWPHQLPYLVQEVTPLGNYNTPKGNLILSKITNSFTTIVEQPSLPLGFSPVSNNEHRAEIINALEADANKYLNGSPPEGVYFKGTWIGALTSLIQLNEAYEYTDFQEDLIAKLKEVLIDSLNLLEYDPNLKSLIASNPEFGHEYVNDHHFHYAYYIRAASVLSIIDEFDPTQYQAINYMVEDIATLEGSEKFPRFRHYSAYEGHSWASGMAEFADGNNQESTSEALNAWYAVYHLGKTTNQKDIEQTGSWLFSQELVGTKTYWFGKNNPFPSEYKHQMASIVWASKRDFATWFSADPMHIYGIQWLPLTPASVYLSQLPNPQSHIVEIDSLVDNPEAHEWGDLYLSYMSYNYPEIAYQRLGNLQNNSGAKLKSLPLHIIYSNLDKL